MLPNTALLALESWEPYREGSTVNSEANTISIVYNMYISVHSKRQMWLMGQIKAWRTQMRHCGQGDLLEARPCSTPISP